jgi:acetyltransferase
MSIRNLDKLFAPGSVALIGATPRPGSVGAVVARNLRRAGFAGELMLVNPHHDTIDGLTVHPNVASLPQPPDLAVIVTPPQTVPCLVRELAERGTRAAVIITAGFGELGEPGRALQQAALDAAKPQLLRIVGPNCVGIMVPRIGLDATFSHVAAAPGGIAFLSQSGAMITAMLDWAVPRGIGFSHVVSLGDMADVDFGDMLDYLAADQQTRAILLYIEGVTCGRKFMSAARAASRLKPVLGLKAGRSNAGARAATSHTGVLAGADAVYDAVFRRAGMLRVATIAELFEAAETLSLTHEQVGARLAILTNGGGAGVLATDALIGAGGQLASLSDETIAELNRVLPPTWSHGNPVDIIGDASGERYAGALTALIRDPDVDAILALNCPTALAEPLEAAAAVIDAIADTKHDALRGRNVITAWLGEHSARPARQRFAKARIATYETPDSAVAGFMHRVCHRRNQELLMETPPARPDAFRPDLVGARHVIATALAAKKSWLDPAEAGAILRAYGVPVVTDQTARDPDDAAAVAAFVGFPVALKIRSPDITHKTDIGGVALGLSDAEQVRCEASAMVERIGAVCPEALFDAIAPYPQHLETVERLRDGTALCVRPLRPEDEPLLHAREIMNSAVVTVRSDTPISDIAKTLREHGISAVPVIDVDGSALGMVSEGDLIGRDEAAREARLDWWLNMLAEGETLSADFLDSVRSAERRARDVMTAPVITVGEETEIDEIARLLTARRIKRVPVLRDGRIVGIVSRADLVRALAEGKR